MKYDGFQLKHVESLYNSLYINTVKKFLETFGPSHMAQITSYYVRIELHLVRKLGMDRNMI